MNTWIICADHTEAIIYRWIPRNRSVEEIERLSHPEGRLKSGEILTDRPGRYSNVDYGRRAPFTPEQDATRVETESFAARVADELEKQSLAGAFDRLILVAEPRMLGIMRRALGTNTMAKVHDQVNRELTQLDNRKLAIYLSDRRII